MGPLPKETALTASPRGCIWKRWARGRLLTVAYEQGCFAGGIGQAHLPLNPGAPHGLEQRDPPRRLAQLSGSSFTTEAP